MNIRLIRARIFSRIRRRISKVFGLIYPYDVLLFFPAGSGTPRVIASLTQLSINQSIPHLLSLATHLGKHSESKPLSIDAFRKALGNPDDAEIRSLLDQKFKEYGSDKSSKHNYHLVYASVIALRPVTGLLEVGLGTNNTKVASNMGTMGKPGASLRTFRDCLPQAKVFGADYDKGILFEEDRIQTFFVDQTKPETFDSLSAAIDSKIDLIIDDGLHAPNANLATFIFALKKMESNDMGTFIVEDITKEALPLWSLVMTIIPDDKFKSFIVQTSTAYMFICMKEES